MSQIERIVSDRSVVTITLDNGVEVMVTSNRDSLNISFCGIELPVTVNPIAVHGTEYVTSNTVNLHYHRQQ